MDQHIFRVSLAIGGPGAELATSLFPDVSKVEPIYCSEYLIARCAAEDIHKSLPQFNWQQWEVSNGQTFLWRGSTYSSQVWVDLSVTKIQVIYPQRR